MDPLANLTLTHHHHIITSMSANSDQFLARAKDKVESLTREVGLLAAQEEGVRRRKQELQQALAEWERAIAIYAEAMELAPPDSPGQITAALDTPEGTLSQLAEGYLAERGPAKINDLVAWLVSVGRLSGDPIKSGQNYGQVYTTLLRHPDRFRKVGRGEFSLQNPPAQPPGGLNRLRSLALSIASPTDVSGRPSEPSHTV
jgi:hypothetical protein